MCVTKGSVIGCCGHVLHRYVFAQTRNLSLSNVHQHFISALAFSSLGRFFFPLIKAYWMLQQHWIRSTTHLLVSMFCLIFLLNKCTYLQGCVCVWEGGFSAVNLTMVSSPILALLSKWLFWETNNQQTITYCPSTYKQQLWKWVRKHLKRGKAPVLFFPTPTPRFIQRLVALCSPAAVRGSVLIWQLWFEISHWISHWL